jgi:hypothetical protein
VASVRRAWSVSRAALVERVPFDVVDVGGGIGGAEAER